MSSTGQSASGQGQAVGTVVVPVKSAWSSKINWIASVSALLVSANELLNQLAPFAPPQYAHDITIAIAVVGAISTVIAKTFYTTSVTPSAAAKV